MKSETSTPKMPLECTHQILPETKVTPGTMTNSCTACILRNLRSFRFWWCLEEFGICDSLRVIFESNDHRLVLQPSFLVFGIIALVISDCLLVLLWG